MCRASGNDAQNALIAARVLGLVIDPVRTLTLPELLRASSSAPRMLSSAAFHDAPEPL